MQKEVFCEGNVYLCVGRIAAFFRRGWGRDERRQSAADDCTDGTEPDPFHVYGRKWTKTNMK